VPGIGREENMENVNVDVILEEVKSMQNNLNELIKRTYILEKSVWEMKHLERKTKDFQKRKYYKEINKEIDFQLQKLYIKVDDFKNAELFRNKIEVPKYTK